MTKKKNDIEYNEKGQRLYDPDEIDIWYRIGQVIGITWIVIRACVIIMVCIAGFLIAFCSVITKNQPK